jgi:glycogen(starch) synthase
MDDHDIYEKSLALRLGLRAGLRQAATVTGCSEFVLADAATRFGLNRWAAEVIYNGVDRTTGPGGGAPAVVSTRYVLGLGRLVRKKGFDLLIRAFASISSAHPDVGLVLAGDGPERPELERLATALGLEERVLFLGRLDQPTVAAVMSGADAFVMPSRIEPFGIVVLEAWRAALPVIASRVGGASEFVDDGVSGLLVDPHDPLELGTAIDRLLRSRELRAGLGSEGHRRLRDFDWEVVADAYLRCYSAAIAKGRSPTAPPGRTASAGQPAPE